MEISADIWEAVAQRRVRDGALYKSRLLTFTLQSPHTVSFKSWRLCWWF